MRKSLSFGAFILTCLMAPGLGAKPIYLFDMTKMYPGNRLTTGCSLCHAVGKEYTSYGNDFLRLKTEIGVDHMDRVWDELGKLDSDNDGIINDVELRRGREPQEPGE